MSLHPQEIPPIPEETARVARAILPQGNRYLLLLEELGTIYYDEQLSPDKVQLCQEPSMLPGNGLRKG